MKKILIISFSNLSSDPRVKRQIAALSTDYRLTAAGFDSPGVPGVEFIQIRNEGFHFLVKVLRAIMLLFRLYEKFYWSQPHVVECLDRFQIHDADLIIANDIYTLPLALRIKDKAKVFFDAHEYHPKEMDDRMVWRIFLKEYLNFLCNKYIAKSDAFTTVCTGIANEYSKFCGIMPEIVTNAASYENILPKVTCDGKIRLIHHGGSMPSRKIESMIKMMEYLDERFELDLMLVPSDIGYLCYLYRLAQRYERVRFISTVPMDEIVRFISNYDIGIYILEPTNFNNMMSLPNKFFEFIQARLAVAIGPSPEMARVVKENQIGVVASDYTPHALADALNNLDSKTIDFYKNQAHLHARNLSSENNMELLRRMVKNLLAEDNQ